MKVLKFGAVWCPGCLVMRPLWQEIEKEWPELLTEYYDVDENKELVKAYAIKEFPCFIFLSKDNTELHREYGEVSKDKLIKFIEQYQAQ
ncbi:MAG TPA: thioredoxin family protein [Candidatus Dojkabacteria bacterium]|jgi:thiol-disulfide isomerase/thioredoxin|nr:thioredoxin family protein [Candidatus Dojkabacteria bacterium]